MFDIDVIIPCYGKSEIIDKGIASLAIQWKKEFIHITLVNDCSPNTDCDYQDLVDKYKGMVDIRCIRTPENYGQGLARQYGIDNTNHDYFMFMDEDDQIGNGLVISIFVGTVESANFKFKENEPNVYELDENGEPKQIEDAKSVAIVSGPVFEFDDMHTRNIPASNRVWVNSKLYCREFLKKHNIRFNEAQSRHAEDYYFMSCFFYALDFDKGYKGILLDDNNISYLWYPNQDSQSRCDEHYPYMLSGYTMDGSVNILKYMKDPNNNIEWDNKEELEVTYKNRLLNMTVYGYFNFTSFINRLLTTDFVPTEQDWYTLRNAINEMRRLLGEIFEEYSYIFKLEEIYKVKNFTDILYVEPQMTFDDFIIHGCDELEMSYEELMKMKEEECVIEGDKKECVIEGDKKE